MADWSDVQQFCYDAPDRGFCSSMATDEKMLKVQRFFFCESNSVRKLFTLPASSSCSAPGPGGYSVCVHERDYLWDCFSDMVYRFYSHLFVPKTLPPRTVESFKVGNFGGKKTTPLGHFPKTRPLLPPTSLRDVSSFTLSLRSYRTPKLPLYIREFCLKKIVLLVKRDTITALR